MSDLHSKLLANKLDEICYNLAAYFNYLIIPRKGFFLVGNDPNGMTIEPVLDLSHIVYLLNEIYPCGNFNYKIASNLSLQPLIETDKKVSLITDKFKDKVKQLINRYIDVNSIAKVEDPVFRESLSFKQIDSVKIHDDVINKIYSFYQAYHASLPQGDEEVKQLLLTILDKRTPYKYGFNTDIQNTAFQSIIYIITALVDSLNIKTVGINEVLTAHSILIPNELEDSYELKYRNDETVRKIITDAFNSKNLTINNEALQLLTDYIHQVSNLEDKVFSRSNINPFDNDVRVLNRMMGFSSNV